MKEETRVSRRNFLKGSILGAGALTTGFGAGLVTPGKAHAALGYLSFQDAGTPVIDPDYVRKRAYEHYYGSGG